MNPILIPLLLFGVALAGCSGSGTDSTPETRVEVTGTTGAIVGVVVDQAIQPVEGANVKVIGAEVETTTDASGSFVVTGLEPGPHFVEASHPLYDKVQQSIDVRAGVADPKPLKFQLTRVVAQDPYMWTQKYQGFISCSANIVGAKSEECGEGVGVPGSGQRVGQNPNNRAQVDFQVDGLHMKSLIVEQVWEPSTEVGGGDDTGKFDTRVALDWACDPVCEGDVLGSAAMASPLLIHVGPKVLETKEYDQETTFSTFTWAEDNPGLLIEQEFELFVSTFYYLEAPEEWSFVAGNENPFGG